MWHTRARGWSDLLNTTQVKLARGSVICKKCIKLIRRTGKHAGMKAAKKNLRFVSSYFEAEDYYMKQCFLKMVDSY